MDIKEVKVNEIDNLDALVNNSFNGTFFASKLFLKIKNVDRCLCIFDRNQIVAIMPLFEDGNGNLIQSTMYIPYGGPILLYNNSNYRKAFIYTRNVIDMITKYIRDKYKESCFSFDPSLTDIIPCVKNGFVPEVRYTYSIDLSNPLDEIFSRFGHDRKKDIRKTQDVSIVYDDNLDYFDIEKALIWEKNYGECSSLDFTREFLLEAIKNNCGKCFVAIKEDKILGGVAIVWDKKRCYIMYSYYEKDTRTVIPKIYYRIIKFLKENNLCNTLDFEGSVFPEIENFNLSFGAKQEIYFNFYLENDRLKLYDELYDYGDKNEKQY